VYRNITVESHKKQPKLYASINKYGWVNFTKEIVFDLVCGKNVIDSIEEKEIKKYLTKGISLNIKSSVKSPVYLSGKNHPRSKSVYQFDTGLNIIKIWGSANLAATTLGFNQTCISKACRSFNPFSYGFYWRYKSNYDYEELTKLIERPHQLSKPVIQLSKSGEFIKEWDSQSLASRGLNIKQGNIWRVLCGKGMSAGGYTWKFKTQ
jgi:hypothetical protein